MAEEFKDPRKKITHSGEEERRAAPRQIIPGGDGSRGEVSVGSLVTAVVALGAVSLLEPELALGVAVGAGVTLLSGWMPNLSTLLRPVVKTVAKAAYAAAEAVSEAGEEIQDVIAEARAERQEETTGQEQPARL